MRKSVTALFLLAVFGAFALVSACSKQASSDATTACAGSMPCSVSTNITN